MGPQPQTVLAFSLVAGVWTFIAVAVWILKARSSRRKKIQERLIKQ